MSKVMTGRLFRRNKTANITIEIAITANNPEYIAGFDATRGAEHIYEIPQRTAHSKWKARLTQRNALLNVGNKRKIS